MYLDGYEMGPVLLKKGVSTYSNNFTGELVGIQISLEFIAHVSQVENRKIHISSADLGGGGWTGGPDPLGKS